MGHGQPPRPRTVPRLNNKPGLILMKTQHVIPLQRERALSVLHRINLRVGAGDVLFNSSSILSPPTTAQDLTRITCP